MANSETEKAIQEIWELFKETDRRVDERFKEIDKQFKETDQRLKKAERMIANIGKQIGALGNEFGGVTEEMAFPSMEEVLFDRFKVEVIMPRARVCRNGAILELDVLAYARQPINAVYVVEEKGRLRESSLEEIVANLERFPAFFPEHRDKALYGIVAAVAVTEAMKRRVLAAGLYLALIREDTFQLDVPEGFQPRRFN